MSGNRSKSAFVEGVGHFERTFQREGSVAHQPLFGIRVAEWLPFVWYKISAVRHLVLSQCTRVTDRRTDGQNYDSQDRPRICSRGKIWGIDPSIPPSSDAYGLKAYRATSHGVELIPRCCICKLWRSTRNKHLPLSRWVEDKTEVTLKLIRLSTVCIMCRRIYWVWWKWSKSSFQNYLNDVRNLSCERVVNYRNFGTCIRAGQRDGRRRRQADDDFGRSAKMTVLFLAISGFEILPMSFAFFISVVGLYWVQ